MPSWQPRGQASPQFDQESEEDMGKKIQYIGRYEMDARTLGKGNFARVELATHKVTSIKVAIKVIDTRKIKEDYVRQNLHREARIMAQLRHPNIIRLYETLKATTLYCLVLEYACGGELLTYIKDHKDSRLTESAARPFFRQLLSALQYLHERGVVHRDLKMENILLDEKKKNIKLVDFGLSNVYSSDQPLKTHCGSPEYAAPELFQTGRTYGPEIDIWSLGIITYAMVVGKLPFIMASSDEYHRRKLLQQIQKGLSKQHEREMQYLTTDFQSLIKHLIEPSPHRRLALPDTASHPWVTRHAKLPFSSYLAPPKDKTLRAQVVVELAELMGMEKKHISESVKEHKADELSAMFNMLVDAKKRQRGVFDADHTIRRIESRTAPPRTKAVGPKGKTDQPGLVKRSVQNKLHVPIEHHVTVPSAETSHANTIPEAASTAKDHKEDGPKKDGSASKPQDSLQPDSCSDLTKRPAHTTSGPSTRIPKRHQTHKLNLTLDLSVVNVPASSRTDSPCQGTRSSGSSLCRSRVQSPSKIPLPRPGVDSQCTSPDDSSTSSHKTKRTCLPLPRHPKPARPARPTSLHFRGSKAVPQPRHPAFQGKGAANVPPEPLVAPKATPEDTNVTSSASDTHLESMQCDMLNASDDEKLEKLEQLKYALLGSCMPRQQSTSDNNTCDDSVNVNHKAEPPGRPSEAQATQRTHKPLTRQFVRGAPVGVKACWSPSKEAGKHRQCENHSGDIQSHSQTDTSMPPAKGRSNSVAQYSGEEEVKGRSPSPHSTARPALLPPSSSNGLPQYQDCVHVCRSHGNEASGKSPPHYEECMHTSRDKVSGSGEIVEVSNTPEGQSSVEASPLVARTCTTCGSQLPQRPRKLFTAGAHALDMFVSPEDASPTTQGWRTSGATTASGSPMQAAPLLRDSPSSYVSTQLPSVANKPQMQITSIASTAKSYSDDNLGSKSGSSQPATANRWSMPPPSPTKRASPKKTPNRTSTGLRFRFSSSADRSKSRPQANSVFSAVPDKSLRLEPVGAESEMPLAEPPAGSNHVSTSSQAKPENGKPVAKLANRLRRGASCDSNSPTVSSSSQRSTPSNSGHLVHRVPTPPASPQKSSPTPAKWVVMKQYDQQRKHTTWRQGLSHLLRRAKPNGAPSNPDNKVEAKPNNTVMRRSRPKTREVYYRQLEAKWTAPASPTSTMCNSMAVTSSPVPSTSPSPQQPFFDITSSRTESPSPRRGMRPAITRDVTKDKALLDAHNEEIVSLDTKLKLENSIESAIHKSLSLSNSLTSRLPLRHRAKVAQQSGPNNTSGGKRAT